MNFMNRVMTGLGMGSFIYLCSLYVNKGGYVTTNTLLFVMIISSGIGLSTVIFDHESWSFFTCLVLHYLVVNLVVFLTSFFLLAVNNYLELAGSIVLVYMCSYLINWYRMKLMEKALNQRLRQRRRTQQ